jgi:hypothetical protein
MRQGELFDIDIEVGQPDSAPPFDGETYDPDRDGQRLGRQLAAVSNLMADGQWRTLSEIAEAVRGESGRASEASCSARLRDLRKPKFGAHTVDRRNAGDGLWEYRVVVPGATQ